MTAATAAIRPPKDETAEALRAKIETLQADQQAAEQRITDETARRPALLRAANSDKEIRASEEVVRQASLVLERTGVLIEDLTAELTEAEDREAVELAKRLFSEAETAGTAFATWWREQYPQLAQQIADGLALRAEARRCRQRYEQAADRAGQIAQVPELPATGHILLPADNAGADPIVGLAPDLYITRRQPLSQRQAMAYER